MPIPSVTRDDIFLAILAMDTYHRGVHSGVGENREDGLGSAIGTQIGTANIAGYKNLDTPDDGSEAIGFVAFRYSWNGKIVYAYRGTDRGFGDFSTTGDIVNGYGVGAARPDGPQARAALTEGPLKDKTVTVATTDAAGRPVFATLGDLLAAAKLSAPEGAR